MTTTATVSHRRARALDALSLAPAAVRERAIAAMPERQPVPGRWLVVDALGATFHHSATEAGEAWLALCDAGLAKSVAWVIDLDAEAGGATGALRRFRQPAVKS